MAWKERERGSGGRRGGEREARVRDSLATWNEAKIRVPHKIGECAKLYSVRY